MLIKKDAVVPRCNNFVLDTSKAGNVACCGKVAGWGITLASGVVWYACLSCLVYRLAIIGDNIDTASVVFYVKDK
jgi:hypothetical protein